MDRASKLRKLNNFRGALPHVSASALSAILGAEELPELKSRHDMRKATAAVMEGDTPYGPVLQRIPLVTKQGEQTSMYIAHPLALLWSACHNCEPFAGFIRDAVIKRPSSHDEPWQLILYSDEVVPGSQLSHDNRRKVWVIYFSFLDLGAAALSCEDMWFCVGAERSSFVKEISGGMGQVFKQVVKLFFGDVHDLATSGIVLNFADGTLVRLFARVGMFLQDGGAHKAVWHCKGDGGTKLCMLCRNLYAEASELVDEDGTDMLVCSIIHEDELDFATDADIRGSVRRLAEKWATSSTSEKRDWTQAIGFRHEPHGMLMDPSLDTIVQPASQFVHDWMHAFFVHGIFTTLSYWTMEAILQDGVRNIWELLHEYVSTYDWPRRINNTALKEMFGKQRMKSSRKAAYLKCTASEGLSVYPVMCLFFLSVVMKANRCINQVAAFVHMSGVIDLLQAVPLNVVTPDALRLQVSKFLTSCTAAGWRLFDGTVYAQYVNGVFMP